MDEGLLPGTPHHLQRLVDHLPSMLAYWDSGLRCRFANRAYEGWFGVDPESLIGASIQDLLGPQLFELDRPHIEGVLRGEEQLFERIVPGPDGVKRHSLASYVPDVVDGIVAGFLVQVTETTRLKLTEEALRDSERKFRALSESSPFGVYLADADGRRTYTNGRWQEIYGLTLEQSLGDYWVQLVHPEDRDAVLRGWRETAAAGSEFDMAFRIRWQGGEERVVRSKARAVHTELGVISGFVGALEDVTERKRAEQRLRASEAFLDRTGRVAGVGGWEVDLRTNTVVQSEQTHRIQGADADYRPTLEDAINFYAPQGRPLIEAAVQDAMRNGTPWDLELPFVTTDGRNIWVRTVGEVEYEAGAPARLVGAIQDVTELRQRRLDLAHEQTLRLQSERDAQELDRLLRERGEMLDVLAHEVRQPLNNASAALQSAMGALIEAGEQVASPRLARAQVALGQVLSSIDNTLAVASLVALARPIQRQDADLDTLIAVVISDLPAKDRSRVRIERLTTTRTASMETSLMRLALRNLLANALKYSPPGAPVSICIDDSDEPLAVILDIVDQGSGIPIDLVPHLFNRGARGAQTPGSTGHGLGLGLGLYIVRRVMELHGGAAELVRNSPDGATFRLVVEQSPGD